MSLISDALKKAQRQRTGPDTVPPIPGIGRAARTEPSSPQSLVWIIAGGIGLVAVAVGLTIFFLRPKAGAPGPAAALPSLAIAKSAAAPAAVSVAPAAIVPIISAPSPVATKSPELAPAVLTPAAAVPVAAAPAAADASSASGQPVTVKRTKTADADPRIIAFVDAIRVTGIRSSGSESKVLMNDKVFRVNDIVERLLNVRLTAVETDSLTFVDDNGVVYTKNF
jgi:hypothetical protein